MSSNLCRSCGKTCAGELKTCINEVIEGTLTYKAVIEKNLGFSMNSNFSSKICEICRAQLTFVAALGSCWRKNEKALTTSNAQKSTLANIVEKEQPVKRKRGAPKIHVKSESEERHFFIFEKIPNFKENHPTSSKSYNTFSNIKELFAENLAFKNVITDLEDFSHIGIDQVHLTEIGEVSADWLRKCVDTRTWSDFSYYCEHCNSNIKGLIEFTKHLKDAGIKGFKVPCVEPSCNRELAQLYSYINHCAEHHEHLAFSCIFCEQRMFYNIPCLVNHYMQDHKNLNFSLYVCLECGHYYQNITQLRVHKMSKHDTIQQLEEQSSEESDEDGLPQKSKKTRDSNWDPSLENLSRRASCVNIRAKTTTKLRSRSMSSKPLKGNVLESHPGKTFHPKVHDVGDRECFPCNVDGCTRVLLSRSGLNYHQMCHTGEKPFKCRICDRGFRSKQSVCSHESNCQ